MTAARRNTVASRTVSTTPFGSRRKGGSFSSFQVREGWVCREVEVDDGGSRKEWVPFGTELNILARTRSVEGEDHGKLLEIVDCDGKRHIWPMPQALLAATGENIRSELLRLGWEPHPNAGLKWRDWLLAYLISADPGERIRCVSGIGWHGRDFVLPDETIGPADDGERIILYSAERLNHALNQAGALLEWQEEVSGKAAGNSRLVLAMSAAFAAPLLALTGDDGGGFHFRGGSSTGKSTALVVAGSIWGGGGTRGYVQSWRATDNALEALAALHNGACLCLDELSQIEPKAAGAAAYMLGNGIGKARAGREGQARKPHQWRLIFLSSGEVGLADKMREGGQRIAAGMEVRVIDQRPRRAGAVHRDDPARAARYAADREADGRGTGDSAVVHRRGAGVASRFIREELANGVFGVEVGLARHSHAVRHAEAGAFRCVDCGKARGRLECDHIIPVRLRPDLAYDPNNCAMRCPSCHAQKTHAEVGRTPPAYDRHGWRKAVNELTADNKPIEQDEVRHA